MTSTTSTTALIDVSDMVVVHRAFRRELGLAPRLVRAVPAGDTARAAVLAAHLRLCLEGLHLHHTGEDDVLWPVLLERSAPGAALVARMEAQHEQVHGHLDALRTALDRWEAEARPAVTEEVAAGLELLVAALLEHLDEEEAEILPLAARRLSRAEWEAVGRHGMAHMERSQLPILFGMVLEECSPAERTAMLGVLPPPVRVLARTVFAWRYRRYVRRVRG
ncbi:hemerythrin domain-containing protein [Trujillonella endophytica]|uniref:Hemerythrin HHE cation binding domain-containing protein n=1 Tax=Trujillonella endophytica TaxID=673521 RepID=A0A1H8PYJ0_9ACTN|nr:hemerythrin domain-containing protein [Trujillella endophytica]SEO46821.1 Hemerythrin HHE cation binding domain-containing protein [Trujillella endophytica]